MGQQRTDAFERPWLKLGQRPLRVIIFTLPPHRIKFLFPCEAALPGLYRTIRALRPFECGTGEYPLSAPKSMANFWPLATLHGGCPRLATGEKLTPGVSGITPRADTL